MPFAAPARVSDSMVASGRFTMHSNSRIAEPVRGDDPVDVDIWPLWERIRVRCLGIPGEISDIPLPDTLARMRASGAATLKVPATGPAPALLDPLQIGAIRSSLNG